ncbi:MAG TPA: type II secretion system protein [Terriglobales bacterium]|nr:type II secretion system protein [Terriglobales bacterium]
MRRSRGFSLIELLIVVAIMLVLAALAVPVLSRARIAANEASAVSTLRSITTSQIAYKISFGKYPASLENLGPSSAPDEAHADLLPPEIANAPNQHNGYRYSATGTTNQFTADAVPLQPGISGNRSFCANTPAELYFAYLGAVCTPGVNLLR